jgi:predicted enzyme related to lactoylglutathione lyase
MPKNALHWFEIPAHDLLRAVRFYNRVLRLEMAATEMMGCPMALFPAAGGVGGALIEHAEAVPSQHGTLVYLDCGRDLAVALGKVELAGGKIVAPKHSIGEHGYCAVFEDCEGNRVGLHSQH